MIYLDHNATGGVHPEVLDAMLPWLGPPANPASVHRAGQRARSALEAARQQVAALVGRPASGLVFTSGASEGNATWWAAQARLGRRRVAVGPMEHPSSLLAAHHAELEVVELQASPDGQVQLSTLGDAQALSMAVANHETGVLQPVDEALALDRPVHLDATQAVGRVPLSLAGAEAVTWSSHKLGGPPGIGALSLSGDEPFPALVPGAQERGRRGGTVPVALAVGFAEAARLASERLAATARRQAEQQAHLESGLRSLGAQIVGASCERLTSVTLAVFPGVVGELLVQALDLRGIAVSSGAACASGSAEPSPVLRAMGHAHPASAVRVSQGPHTTTDELDELLTALAELLPLLSDPELA